MDSLKRQAMFENADFQFNLALSLEDRNKAKAGLDSIVRYSDLPPGISLQDLILSYNDLIIGSLENTEGDIPPAETRTLRACALIELFAKASLDKDIRLSNIRSAQRLAKLENRSDPRNTTPMIAAGSSWKYTLAAVPENWATLEYADDHWKAGPAPLGFGDEERGGQKATDLSEFREKVYTLYLRQKFPMHRHPSSSFRVVVRTVFDDGIIVYLNGDEIHSSNMQKDGVITATTPASSSRANEESAIEFEVPVSRLKLGENILAAEVHQHTLVSSDMHFELSATLMPKEGFFLTDLSRAELRQTLEETSAILPASLEKHWLQNLQQAALASLENATDDVSAREVFQDLCERIWHISRQ